MFSYPKGKSDITDSSLEKKEETGNLVPRCGGKGLFGSFSFLYCLVDYEAGLLVLFGRGRKREVCVNDGGR